MPNEPTIFNTHIPVMDVNNNFVGEILLTEDVKRLLKDTTLILSGDWDHKKNALAGVRLFPEAAKPKA